MNYVEKLVTKMREEAYEEEYISLCASYASKLLKNNVPVIFDFKHLALLLGCEPSELTFYLFARDEQFYSEIQIPKKNGEKRTIDIPSEQLKNIQRWILDNILIQYELHEDCFGFRKGKSICDNAARHVKKECVLNFDLKDFFPSIKYEDVYYLFYNKGYTKKVSYYLTKLLTKDGVLPQGSPASPMVSNIVALKLDKRLSCLAKKYNAEYSRYADDITFSGKRNITNMISLVKDIIEDENFKVNENKIRYAYYYQRQEVTGLIVNEKVSVSKAYIRELKKEIFFCQKYGVNSHLQRINCSKSFYKEHLFGKAYFVYMVEEDLGTKLLIELNKIEWEY